MSEHVEDINAQIKNEAVGILFKKGLLDILSAFGKAHVHGSYFLDLMAWRDLDIYLETENITEVDFFMLGGRIAASLNPTKMSFRNETIARTKGLPNGMYWGIYLGDERNGAWKIDIWAVSFPECQRLLVLCEDIKKKLTPVNSLQILKIKSQCWQNPGYRRSFSSMHIYTAVLEKGITDLRGFEEFLKSG